MTCECPPTWLTSHRQPVTAEQAVENERPCCDAPKGKRCHGGTAGWLDKAKSIAWVDVCPARLEVQRTLV